MHWARLLRAPCGDDQVVDKAVAGLEQGLAQKRDDRPENEVRQNHDGLHGLFAVAVVDPENGDGDEHGHQHGGTDEHHVQHHGVAGDVEVGEKPGLRTGSVVRTDMSNPASLFVAFILIP